MNPSGLAWQYRTFYSNPLCQIAIRVKLEWLEYKENKTRLVEVKEQIPLQLLFLRENTPLSVFTKKKAVAVKVT